MTTEVRRQYLELINHGLLFAKYSCTRRADAILVRIIAQRGELIGYMNGSGGGRIGVAISALVRDSRSRRVQARVFKNHMNESGENRGLSVLPNDLAAVAHDRTGQGARVFYSLRTGQSNG